MKMFLVTLVVFAGTACAQEGSTTLQPKAPEPGARDSAKGGAVVRRLESVTWNPVRAELTWLVSVWNVDSNVDEPDALERYVIHPDTAVMASDEDVRPFDPAEAKRVRNLMDVISTYAVGSTVWWAHGGGLEPDGQVPQKKDKDGNLIKEKGDDKQESPKAVPKPLPGVLRALGDHPK